MKKSDGRQDLLLPRMYTATPPLEVLEHLINEVGPANERGEMQERWEVTTVLL